MGPRAGLKFLEKAVCIITTVFKALAMQQPQQYFRCAKQQKNPSHPEFKLEKRIHFFVDLA